jgi:hypothetical protein
MGIFGYGWPVWAGFGPVPQFIPTCMTVMAMLGSIWLSKQEPFIDLNQENGLSSSYQYTKKDGQINRPQL